MKSNIFIETENNNTYFYDLNYKEYYFAHPIMKIIVKFNITQYNEKNTKIIKTHSKNSFSKTEIKYYIKKYNYLKYYGFFNSFEIKDSFITEISVAQVKNSIKNLNNIVFEVTDKCNLNCLYCGYGELYYDHDDRIGKNINQTQIELFLNKLIKNYLIYSNDLLSIGFYGGEPLMNMSFIKDIIKIFNKKLSQREINYRMTTNGVLLKKHIRFLLENNFTISVSIDGNKKNHSYRIFKSGKNSFTEVIKNLEYVYNKYPQYFKENINFLAVLHNRNSINEANSFLLSKFGKTARFSPLDNSGITPEKRDFFKMIYKDMSDEIKISDREINIKNFENDPLALSLGMFLTERINSLSFERYEELIFKKTNIMLPGGACFPFQKKMFITVNGKILVCERINQKYSLGNIKDDKLDFNYIAKFYNNIYKRIVNQCSHCYKAQYCKQCFLQIDDFEKSYKCPSFTNIKKFSNYLSFYINRLEDYPELFIPLINEFIFK